MKKKRDDLGTLGWVLLAGSGTLGLYLLLRPAVSAPSSMVPTVDTRLQPMPVANLLRSK